MNRHTKDSESISTLEDTIPPSIASRSIGTQEPVNIEPPFLVRTKTREEKDMMRQQFKNQESLKDKRPYGWLQRFYARFSTSFMLENKAATARDHLAPILIPDFLLTANERTFLAWLRTSLSLITVGVAITQLYHLTPPGEQNQVTHAKAGKSLGATFVVFSILFLYFANARYFHAQIALTKGQFPASRGAVIFGSTCILAVLIAMFIVILLDMK
ncbi:hypothetical protein MFLAVUS_002423 [Mucor flavus]|uniref:DUF202 domain-containing protein n=1 Tax=Mucor flavus TaxID=439312 RepID=A0ABP9YQ76_9FUNG